MARAGRLDDGLALVEEVLASPQGAYVSRYPLALFVLHAVRVGQGPRVAGRLAGMLEVRMVWCGVFVVIPVNERVMGRSMELTITYI